MIQGTAKQRTDTIYYASPLIFLAACALLALIIGVFAVNNYQREKRLNELILKQEATAILNLVAAGSRSALRRGFMRGELSQENWIEFFAQTLENTAEHPGLLGLYLVDQNGVIRTHSDPHKSGGRVDATLLQLINGFQPNQGRTYSAILGPPFREQPVFLMSRPFLPAALMDGPGLNRGRMGRMGPDSRPPPEPQERMRALAAGPLTMVVELSLEGYQQAVRKQILQIIILSLVLLLVGGGGLLSLVLIHNYRGSQKRLKSIHTFTDTLVASLPLGLIAVTEEGRLRTCNPSAAQMLGLNEQACLGQKLGEVVDQRIFEQVESYRHRQLHSWEMEPAMGSGIDKSLLFTRVNIASETETDGGYMLLVQDLSKVRQLEVQLQRAERDAAVGRMAAGVAHELRNPLSSVKGLALLLKSRFKEDLSSQQTADLMVDQVERLDRSISELLDYARPGLLTKTTLHIDELLGKAVMLVRTDADTQQITIDESYGCGTVTMEGDGDKLTQLFLNLFLNGIQAMESGGRLLVSTSCSDTGVTITIEDNGSGIPADLQDKVFEPYFTTKNDGTGLGLAMSARIVHDHHGAITLESIEQEGTTVTVNLPYH